MKPAFIALLALALPLVACDPASQNAAAPAAAPAAPTGPTLEGVWKRAESVIAEGEENAGTHTADVQPSLYIFTKTHYSMNIVTSYAPRTDLSATPTDAERAAAFAPFTAQAGTYKLDGVTLTLSPVVAKTPNVMSGTQPVNPITIEWAGDDLWFAQTAASGAINKSRLTRVAD